MAISSPSPRHPSHPGFTLAEVMIAMVVLSFLMAGVAYFMRDVGRGLFWGTEKAEISRDVRQFTLRLAAEARSANSAIIYSSLDPQDRAKGSDRRDDRLSGDCLILINTEPFPEADDPEHYTRIIAYYRQPDDKNESPVYRFEWPAPGTSGTAHYVNASETTIEDLLKQIVPENLDELPVVVELSRGMADGRLFTNFRQGRVIVVNGEILHGNLALEVTNTYNLSISPRG